MKRGGTEKLQRLLLACFLAFWAGLCLLICNYNRFAVIPAAALFFALLAVGPRLEGLLQRLPVRCFWGLFWGLALVFFLSCTAFALAARVGLPSDTDIVFESVADLLRDGRVDELNPKLEQYYPQIGLKTNADYFCMYYNNIGLLALLAGVYRLAGAGFVAGIDQGQAPALVFTALCVLATALLICRVSYRLTGRRSAALLALLLCMGFQPFYFGLPNFYTDIIVLPFAMAGVAALTEYAAAEEAAGQAGKGALLWPAAAGALLALAAWVKVTAAVFAVAAVIALVLMKGPAAARLQRAACFLLPFMALMAGLRWWTFHSGWIDFGRRQALAMPWQLWLCFGARGVGYNYEEALAAALAPAGQRGPMLWQRLGEIYGGYSFYELVRLEVHKLVATWGDGRFEAALYTLWPLEINWTGQFTQPQGAFYSFCLYAGQVFLLILYFGAAAAVWRALRAPKPGGAVVFYVLCVMGLAAYLLLFETAARRALLALPLMLAGAGCVFTEPGAGGGKAAMGREKAINFSANCQLLSKSQTQSR